MWKKQPLHSCKWLVLGLYGMYVCIVVFFLSVWLIKKIMSQFLVFFLASYLSRRVSCVILAIWLRAQ